MTKEKTQRMGEIYNITDSEDQEITNFMTTLLQECQSTEDIVNRYFDFVQNHKLNVNKTCLGILLNEVHNNVKRDIKNHVFDWFYKP